MFLLQFYRFYFALAVGTVTYFTLIKTWWGALLGVLISRILWILLEHALKRRAINRSFNQHETPFKQQMGPYGIRMVNKADSSWQVKKSLAEVFVKNVKQLRKNVEQLEIMDTLFRAGMRPDGESYQLHDLKFKYGKWRLEQLQKL